MTDLGTDNCVKNRQLNQTFLAQQELTRNVGESSFIDNSNFWQWEGKVEL